MRAHRRHCSQSTILRVASGALLLTALSPALVTAQNAPFGHKTVFRYRSFEGPRPGWVSPITGAGGINHSVGGGDVLAYDRGTGFERFLFTSFDGSEYIRASSSIDTVDTAGHDSFTIQVWFRASGVDGWRTLVSNTASNRGFSLKIHNGELRGLVRLGTVSPVHIELRGGAVTPGVWHHAAFRVKEQDTSYDLRMFLNGERVGNRTSGHFGGIRQSSEHPMIGAEPSGGTADGSMFVGLIYAVAIQNYAVGTSNYLENDAVRDGSRYYGSPSYHDYLSGTRGPDHRISDTIRDYPDVAKLALRRYLPFQNDSYIPQGVASNGDDRVYVTMYYLDRDGNNPGGLPPIAVEMDTAGNLLRVFRLQGLLHSDHVGGAAVHGNWLYTPDGSDVVRFDLGSTTGNDLFDPDTFVNNRHDTRSLDAVDRFPNALGGLSVSFLSTSPDSDGSQILWCGDFDRSVNSIMRGFEMNGDGTVGEKRHEFILPVKDVQGVYCYRASASELRFYFSSSFGDNPSVLREVVYDRGFAVARAQTTLLTLPAGLEDLAMIGDRLWTVSESGAKYYQKRSSNPWSEMFPFVFAYDPVAFEPFGEGCPGTVGTPLLDGVLGDVPRIGEVFEMELSGLPSGPVHKPFGVIGLSKTQWGQLPLPLDLGQLGAWGCTNYVSVDASIGLVNAAGKATWQLPIPNDPSLEGLRFYVQGAVLDFGVNAASFINSNAGEVVIRGR